MNPEQSFYGYEDWHLPSPSSTPQTSRFDPLALTSPSQDALFSTPPLDSHWPRSPGLINTQHDDSLARHGGAGSIPGSTAGVKRNYANAETGSPTKSQPPRSSQIQASFPTTSFLDRFEGATLQESDAVNEDSAGDQSQTQMRTPPPTRDSSHRKRQLQRELNFASPSTIQARRQSVPETTWLKKNDAVSMNDLSPFQFSPIDFNSPDIFGNLGPATAPVLPQANLFWDPDTKISNPAFASMSTINEDPFISNIGPSFASGTNDLSQHDGSNSTRASTLRAHLNSASKSRHGRTLLPGSQSSDRPRSGILSSSSHLMSSVDPSVLSKPVDRPSMNLLRSNSFSASTRADHSRQPYQFHIDQMKREKERQRASSATRRSATGLAVDVASFSGAEQGPRRNLSARRNDLNRLSTSSLKDLRDESDAMDDLRSSSPLKRQRSNAQVPARSLSAQRVRRSVVLTVDGKGHARTEVKLLSPDLNGGEDDSDSYDETVMPITNKRSSSLLLGVPDSSGGIDAQTALRDVMRTRQKRQGSQSSSNSNRDSISTHSARTANHNSSRLSAHGGQTVTWSLSPTMSEGHEWPAAPNSQKFQPVSGFRCICDGSSDSGQPLIQCAMCSHVLHMQCCGLHPLAPPTNFTCPFCIDAQAPAPGRAENWIPASMHHIGNGFD